MSQETSKSKLLKWCAEKSIFSKADLHKYGYENHYLRAWRTVCNFVNEGVARKLTEQECKKRNLTTSMAWYEFVGESARTDHEQALSDNNLSQEKAVNERAAFEDRVTGQMSFIG